MSATADGCSDKMKDVGLLLLLLLLLLSVTSRSRNQSLSANRIPPVLQVDFKIDSELSGVPILCGRTLLGTPETSAREKEVPARLHLLPPLLQTRTRIITTIENTNAALIRKILTSNTML